MNNARCIVAQPCEDWPEGLIPVESCLQCKFTIAGHSHCLAGDFNIKDFSQIHKSCPLPFYEEMRPHGPDEVPEPGTEQIVTIESGERFVARYDKLYKTWVYRDNDCALVVLLLDEIESWKYLEPK